MLIRPTQRIRGLLFRYLIANAIVALTADDEGGVAEGGESGALVVDVRLQRVRLGALPFDVLFDCDEDVVG